MNHFETFEQYHQLCNQLDFGQYRGRFYQNSRLAVYDIVQSQIQYMSHKPQIGAVRSGTPLIENLVPMWMRQQTPVQYKPDSENMISWLKTLSKDTNFVIWASEHEITGEYLYSDQQIFEIHQYLSSQRIFSIQIIHPHRKIPYQEIFNHGYAVLIQSNGLFLPEESSVFFTEKLKAPSLIGPLQSLASTSPQLNPTDFKCLEIDETHLNLLSQFNYFNQFAGPVTTLKDRIVLSLTEVTGQRMIEELVFNQQIQPQHAFAISQLPTWVIDSISHWWPEIKNEKMGRHLLVISSQAFAQNSSLAQQILGLQKSISDVSKFKI